VIEATYLNSEQEDLPNKAGFYMRETHTMLGVSSCARLKPGSLEADGKCPYARLPKSRGMRRTEKYAAMTRDEDNVADGRFPSVSLEDD